MKIRFLGLAAGGPHAALGEYLISYDPDYHLPDGEYDGGELITTSDPAKATDFALPDAVRIWRSGPTCHCHRTRQDGKPNRPLTAFNVEIR